jgi:hypothetical protein
MQNPSKRSPPVDPLVWLRLFPPAELLNVVVIGKSAGVLARGYGRKNRGLEDLGRCKRRIFEKLALE